MIVSEPMGYMLFNERMLESHLHAKKWLKPDGEICSINHIHSYNNFSGMNFASSTVVLLVMYTHCMSSHYPRFNVPYEGDTVLCSFH